MRLLLFNLIRTYRDCVVFFGSLVSVTSFNQVICLFVFESKIKYELSVQHSVSKGSWSQVRTAVDRPGAAAESLKSSLRPVLARTRLPNGSSPSPRGGAAERRSTVQSVQHAQRLGRVFDSERGREDRRGAPQNKKKKRKGRNEEEEGGEEREPPVCEGLIMYSSFAFNLNENLLAPRPCSGSLQRSLCSSRQSRM